MKRNTLTFPNGRQDISPEISAELEKWAAVSGRHLWELENAYNSISFNTKQAAQNLDQLKQAIADLMPQPKTRAERRKLKRIR